MSVEPAATGVSSVAFHVVAAKAQIDNKATISNVSFDFIIIGF
jgi:hypothetical protein